MPKLLIAFCCAAISVFAQGSYKAAATGGPTDQLSQPVREELEAQGVKITDPNGYTFAEVWLRSTPVADSTSLADALQNGSIPQGTLVAAIRYYAPGADSNGRGLRTATYTLRFDAGDTVMVIPAADDQNPAPMPAERMQELAKKSSRRDTPATLRFTKGGDGNTPRLEMTGGGEWILHLKAGDTPADLLVLGVSKG